MGDSSFFSVACVCLCVACRSDWKTSTVSRGRSTEGTYSTQQNLFIKYLGYSHRQHLPEYSEINLPTIQKLKKWKETDFYSHFANSLKMLTKLIYIENLYVDIL